MGVTNETFVFDGPPPSEETFLRALQARVGDISGVESYRVIGLRVEVRCLYDPYTATYGSAILQELGGRPVPHREGLPLAPLPSFVKTPWRDLPRLTRLSIWLRWHLTYRLPP